jgi:hypothetical protein
MARKKAAIGELIKSDMSRRNIGENAVSLEFADEPVWEGQQAEAAPPAEKPAEEAAGCVREERSSGQSIGAEKKPEKARPAPEPEPKPAAKTGEHRKTSPESVSFFDYIAAEVESGGSMDEQERRNFYDFMLAQAARYVRGFNAGKRFYQG